MFSGLSEALFSPCPLWPTRCRGLFSGPSLSFHSRQHFVPQQRAAAAVCCRCVLQLAPVASGFLEAEVQVCKRQGRRGAVCISSQDTSGKSEHVACVVLGLTFVRQNWGQPASKHPLRASPGLEPSWMSCRTVPPHCASTVPTRRKAKAGQDATQDTTQTLTRREGKSGVSTTPIRRPETATSLAQLMQVRKHDLTRQRV